MKEVGAADAVAKMGELLPSGQVAEQWVFAAGLDPAFVEKQAQMGKHVMQDGALSLGVKEIIATCMVAARGYLDRVPLHVERALDAGATEAEVLDGLEVASLISGVPTMMIGLTAMMEARSKRTGGG